MLRLGASLSTSAPAGSSLPNLLLDDYAGGVRAYSMRKLKKDYSGYIVRVRGSGDNEEVDVAFDDNNELSHSSKVYNASGSTADGTLLSTFHGFRALHVTKWYDQSSAGVDITQPTALSQPTMGTWALTTSNGKPSMRFNGTTNLMLDSTSMNIGSLSAYTVSANDNHAYATYQWPWGLSTAGGNFFGQLINNSLNLYYYGGQYSISNTSSAEDTQQIKTFHAGTSAAPTMYQNNAAGSGSGTRVDSATSTSNNNIGAWDNGATLYGWQGDFQEFIAFDTDTISDRAAITTNINDYWGSY